MKPSKSNKNFRLLAVDIGNTSAQFGVFAGTSLRETFRIATYKLNRAHLLEIQKKIACTKPSVIIIASVVPEAGRFLRRALPVATGVHTVLIGKDLQVPVVNKYTKPSQVGTDRLLNALAAFRLCRKEAIVIDFGTAITFDVVSRKGEYLGGVIAPGIEISIEALFQKTALLPKIKLAHPKTVIGRETVESIRIGCSYGIGGLCDRIVQEIKAKHGLRPLVIATGGYAEFMSRYCRSIDRIEPDLTLRGMLISYIE